MTGVLVVGESILDVIHDAGSGGAGPDRRELPGGSPANVAVGLARLGHDVGLWTSLGSDTAGQLLREHLEGNGIRLPAPAGGTTSKALAHLQPDGSARYDFDVTWPQWEGRLAAAEEGEHVHTGSIAALLQPGAAEVQDLLLRRRSSATTSYDPNVRPALLGPADACRPHVERLVATSDVVKASDEDLLWLHPGREPLDVAREWMAEGPALVVVTRGGDGCLAVTATGDVAVPSVPVDVVDTVGAGDSFMAALLDALSRAGVLGGEVRDSFSRLPGQDVAQALRWAAAAAAITCGRPGADPPTTAELRAATQG